MKRIVISGYFGFDNAGDEAILAAMVNRLNKAGKELIILSGNPEKTEQKHQVNAISRTDLMGISRILKSADMFISGGGSLLQDITGGKTIPYYLGMIMFAKMHRVPVAFFSQGVGPVTKRFNKQLIARVLNIVDYISVRDVSSKELLKSLGVRNKIDVTADPVFSLRGTENESTVELVEKKIPADSPVIGVAPRPWMNDDYLDSIAAALNQVSSNLDVHILVLPLHYPDDVRVGKKLMNKLESRASLVESALTPTEHISLIGHLDFMIGIRLHSLIFSAVSGIPFSGISYDPKIDALLEQFNSQVLSDISNIDSQSLAGGISKAFLSRQELQKKQREKTDNLRFLSEKGFTSLEELIGDTNDKG